MGMELTARQQEIYDFLRERRDGAGICPSHEEIRHHFGFRSSNAAQDHLNAMEKKGWIKRDPGKARSIHLIEKASRSPRPETVNVPLVGWIPAGNPAFVLECHEEVLTLPKRLFAGNDLFALRVKGESMTGAGIFDGDIAVLSARQDWVDGMIVALVLDEEATLKRLYRTPAGLRLHAENPAWPDRFIPATAPFHCRVAGVLSGTIRRFF